MSLIKAPASDNLKKIGFSGLVNFYFIITVMVKLPDFKKAFEYENNFFLTCDNTRLSKVMAQYDLFKMILDLPGAIVECGIFKATSFLRFAAFRQLFGGPFSRKLIGFDIFGKFPETNFEEDKKYRANFVKAAGDESISQKQLMEVMKMKGVDRNVELVPGDVVKTVPEYFKKNPHVRIALINLDTDVYEPAVAVLEHCWPLMVKGGIIMFDNYGIFPGETKAADEYFHDKDVQIFKFPYALAPSYVIKE